MVYDERAALPEDAGRVEIPGGGASDVGRPGANPGSPARGFREGRTVNPTPSPVAPIMLRAAITPDEYRRIKMRAAERGVTVSAEVGRLLRRGLTDDAR